MTYQVKKSELALAGVEPEKFAEAVGAFAKQKAEWLERERIVEEEDKKPLPPKPEWGSYAKSENPAQEFAQDMKLYDEELAKRHARFPAPVASPLIMACVDDAANPAYQIVDDEEEYNAVVLANKKRKLVEQVNLEEARIADLISPPGKRRINKIGIEKVQKEDQARFAAAQASVREMSLSLTPDQDAIMEIQSKVSLGIVLTEHDENRRDAAMQRIKETVGKINHAQAKLFDQSAFLEETRTADEKKIMSDYLSTSEKLERLNEWAAVQESDIEDLTRETVDAWKMKPFGD